MAFRVPLDLVPKFVKCTEMTVEMGLQPNQLELITLLTCERSSRTNTSDDAAAEKWRRQCLELAMGHKGRTVDPESRFSHLSQKLYWDDTSTGRPMNLKTLDAAIQRAQSCALSQLQMRSLRLLNVLVFLLGAMLVAGLVGKML
jgi:hypothetical protein